jgi:hypothetical protein
MKLRLKSGHTTQTDTHTLVYSHDSVDARAVSLPCASKLRLPRNVPHLQFYPTTLDMPQIECNRWHDLF